MFVEIKHHYGWKVYDVPAATLEEAAYLAVRESHGFLTDDNHRYEAGEKEFPWGGKIIKFNSVTIFREGDAPESLAPWWAEADYWFAVEFRAPETNAAAA
jgi:hypothetical protein